MANLLKIGVEPEGLEPSTTARFSGHGGPSPCTLKAGIDYPLIYKTNKVCDPKAEGQGLEP